MAEGKAWYMPLQNSLSLAAGDNSGGDSLAETGDVGGGVAFR